jgi:hypothetical protein
MYNNSMLNWLVSENYALCAGMLRFFLHHNIATIVAAMTMMTPTPTCDSTSSRGVKKATQNQNNVIPFLKVNLN